MPGTVTDPPSVSLSFANNFWGQNDAGVGPLLGRMHDAKTTCDEMKAFYSARAALEDEYAKKLLALARKPLGSCEAGTLRLSLDVVRAEVESMGKAHANIAGQMKSELDESLSAFAGGMKERRKIVQNSIEKLLKVKLTQNGQVNKARDKFEQDCLKIKGYLAQGHMVMGQEERKVKAKLEKTQIQLSSTSAEYEGTVKTLEETTGRWNREWKAACDKFQDLEEERIDFMKSSLWTFANVASTVCVSDDASCEKIRLSLEDCDVEKDICTFIKEHGTGQEIPDPPKFIDFCRGDVNDTASEADEEASYTVAQFPRAINPTIRSSSPQPSTFESHNGPDTSINEEFRRSGSSQVQASAGYDVNQQQQQSRSRQPTNPAVAERKQVQREVPNFAPQGAAQVPHDPYPRDGMTQFCRTGPPPVVGVGSDLSSASSNMRPSSRDSQSDYSHPTDYSRDDHMDKRTQSTSPTKYAPPVVSEEIQDSPKKRGFFNSPFTRRKSKHGNDMRPAEGGNRPVVASQETPRPKQQDNRPPLVNRNSNAPDPRSPRAPGGNGLETNYQLNVGNNVFDVSPNARSKKQPEDSFSSMDPIAQALEDLKDVTKASGLRVSADRYAGVATPAPVDGGRATPMNNHISALAAAQKGTPPPTYVQPASRLGAPPPAHTSRTMQETTRRYTAQRQDTFGESPHRQGGSISRPASRGAGSYQGQPDLRQGRPQDRPTSRGPSRSPSPNPGFSAQTPRGQSYNQPQHRPSHSQDHPSRPLSRGPDPRAPSPQPGYHPGQGPAASRPRANTNSPYKQPQPMYSNYDNRGSSPQPGWNQRGPPPQQQQQGNPMQSRPGSSRGDAMSMQLAQPDNSPNRPGSRQYGDDPGFNGQAVGRVRTKSFAGPQNLTKDGLPIMHYARAMYLYNAQIPEEMGFAKGDLLAVLRLQDDGWWEAEVVGKSGRGLVPSNYLKIC